MASGLVRNVWNSGWLGYRFVLGMVIYPVVLVLLGLVAVASDAPVLWVGVGVGAPAWVVAWLVVLRSHREIEAGRSQDLTPGTLAVPIVVMVAAAVVPWFLT